MRVKILAILLSALALSWAAGYAQAGAIRSAGKELGNGSVTVAHATVDAAQAAAGGAAAVGKTTGGALGSGVATVGKGAAAVPGAAARGTKAAAKGIWKAVW